MKKNTTFCIFLFVFGISSFFIFSPKNVFAEDSTKIEGYSVHINYEYSGGGEIINNGKINYANFEDGKSLKITASLVPTEESAPPISPTYKWEHTGNTITSQNFFVINKTITQKNSVPLLIGSSKYTFTATDTSSGTPKTLTTTITINVEHTSGEEILVQAFLTSDVGKTITMSTNPFELNAILPIYSAQKAFIMYKAPNFNKYDFLTEAQDAKGNVVTTTINPAQIITSQNGLGTYEFVACVKCNNNYYYSNTLFFEATSIINPNKQSDFENNKIKILQKDATNSIAYIEAKEFTINNINYINDENIVWYIGNERVASGASFVYEPTSKTAYRITAKYLVGNQFLTIDSLVITPKATNTWIVFASIAGVVSVLSSILAISIIKINKKRDVVW